MPPTNMAAPSTNMAAPVPTSSPRPATDPATAADGARADGARADGAGADGARAAGVRAGHGAGSTAWMDLARIVAVVAVVFAHVASPAVSPAAARDIIDPDGAAWWVVSVLNAAARFCVPTFIMISGALLLRPQASGSTRSFYRKRLRRVGPALAAWSGLYLGLRLVHADEPLTLRSAATDLAAGVPYYHLYFLFVLAGLYVLTPFLRIIVAHAKPRMLVAFTTVLLALGAGDQALSMLLATGRPNAVTRFLPYAGYFVAGLLLQRLPLTRRLARRAAVGFVLAVATTAVGSWALIHLPVRDQATEYFLQPLSPSVIVTAGCAFIGFRCLGERMPALFTGASGRAVATGSALSFGVYLVHPAILTELRFLFPYPPGGPGVLGTVATTLAAVLGLAASATAIGRRVPGVRALL